MDQGRSSDSLAQRKGDYISIRDSEDPQLGLFDKPLPCCGCGIGWCSLVLCSLPLLWKVLPQGSTRTIGSWSLCYNCFYMHISCSNHRPRHFVVIFATALHLFT